jgi:hypothetical protein
VWKAHKPKEGLKWVKKKKIKNEVRKNKSLKENIKEDKESKKIDHRQLNKRKKIIMGALEHLAENKEEQVGEALKMRVMWT